MSQRPGTHVPSVRAETEKSLGITQRSAAINFAWTGDIRKRYTDFLVFEIAKDGTVLHLRDFEEDEALVAQQAQYRNGLNGGAQSTTTQLKAPVTPTQPTVPEFQAAAPEPASPAVIPISEDDQKTLVAIIGEASTEKLVQLDLDIQAKKQIPANERNVVFDAIDDRAQRAALHQHIREIFKNRLSTLADGNGVITASPAQWNSRGNNQGRGQRRDNRNNSREATRSFAQLGGDYLHFTLYKENKDTMDAINTIARLLKVKATNFGFAGTKDRRAATVQRISVFRQRASNLIWLNTRLPTVKVGDFTHSKEPLQLGQHGGNEFVITIKNCQPLGGSGCSVEQRVRMLRESVESGLSYLKHHGYINYYGLQRFGTYSIGTHLLGMKILKGDFEGVVDDILHVDDHYLSDVLDNNPNSQSFGNDFGNNRDDFARAKAITIWKTTRSAAKATEILPKRFSSEGAIIRHLASNPKDFQGAILRITRGMRQMYIHAYQSYVWNYMVSRRWAKYGATLIEGDLVLKDANDDADAASEIDDDNFYAQAQALTKEDIASGKYSIFDVVMPTPGFDVMYPRNDIGEHYVSFMKKPENGELDPYDMRRRNKEFSLSGNYRHIVGRFIREPEYAVRVYSDDTEQMYPTDLDFCNQKKAQEKLQKLEEAASKARWTHFANNAAEWDNLLTADRRRKASEDLEADGRCVMNETWVETGMDGSAKRVKVARHHQQLENEADPFKSEGAAFVGDPLRDVTNTSSPMEGVVEAKPAPAETSPNVQSTAMEGAEVAECQQPPASNPLGWYGSSMPTVSEDFPATPGFAENPNSATDKAVAEAKAKADLVTPIFCPASENPLVSVNPNLQVVQSDSRARKIAIILKFQLKSSNYATVVLRELMGANSDDNLRFSSPERSTPERA